MPQELRFTSDKIRATDRAQTMSAYLPLAAISRLKQMRETFEDLAELTTSIEQKGQLAPGIAAVLTKGAAQNYVQALNAIRHTNHTLEELTEVWLDGKRRYVILIAGERRYRACTMLEDAHPGKGAIGKYRRLYSVTLYFGISIDAALEIQLQENLHKPVPPMEAALYTRDLFAWRRLHQPSLSLAQFAKSIARSDGWVRDALRFCELPIAIQQLASQKSELKVPYQLLVALERFARLMRTECGTEVSEHDLLQHVHLALARRMNAKRFRGYLNNILETKRGGQGQLFAEMQVSTLTRADTDREVLPGLLQFNAYMKQLEAIRRQGAFGDGSYLGSEDEVLGNGNAKPAQIGLLAQLGDMFQTVAPHTEALAGKKVKLDAATDAAGRVERSTRILNEGK